MCIRDRRKLKLRHTGQQVGILVSFHAKLVCHIRYDIRDARIVLVRAVCHQQVQLGIFLYLHAKVIQRFDRRVAGKEILRARTEGDDFEVRKTDQHARYGNEVRDHVRDLLRGTHRIFRDIRLEVPQAEVI